MSTPVHTVCPAGIRYARTHNRLQVTRGVQGARWIRTSSLSGIKGIAALFEQQRKQHCRAGIVVLSKARTRADAPHAFVIDPGRCRERVRTDEAFR